MNLALRLNHVRIGWRVRHFRSRKDGSYLHGTVTGPSSIHPAWCKVLWDGKRKVTEVMIECLEASDKPGVSETTA